MEGSLFDPDAAGFVQDGRVVVVSMTLVTTFPVVEGMYSLDATDSEIVSTEIDNALKDPAAYIEDAEIAVIVKVEKAVVK